MRPSLLSAVITSWFTAAFGFHVTTFAANEEDIVTPGMGESPAEDIDGGAAREEGEASANEKGTPGDAAEESPSGASETTEGEGSAGEIEEEMLDAESLLSEEELRALEAEFGDYASVPADDVPSAESPALPSVPDGPAGTSQGVPPAPENFVRDPQGTDAASEKQVSDEKEALQSSETDGNGKLEAVIPADKELPDGLGVAIPLSRREPTLSPFQLEGGFRYGLVGTGPTRFVDDLRFSWAEGVELRTSFSPYPSSLMLRLQAGKSASDFGAWVIDAGIANWDAGWRLVVDTGEAEVGARVHWEVVLAWQKVLTDKLSWFNASHLRYRMSGLSDDDQNAVAFESVLTYDLMSSFSVSGGLGYARTLGTPVREVAISFVETGRPGITHFLVRDDVLNEDLPEADARQSVTIPLALTYGTTESFDVDLFCTPRIFPKFDIVFGAGLRIRYDLL